MPTAGSLMTTMRELVGDADGDRLGTSAALSYLSMAQTKMCNSVWPLKTRKGFTATEGQDEFDVPTDCVVIDGVWLRVEADDELEYVDDAEYRRMMCNMRSVSGQPTYYTRYEDNILLDRQMSNTSDYGTLSTSVATADTTMYLATTSVLPAAGQGLVDSEQFRWSGKTATTLTGCTRGVGNTTATSHATDASIAVCDLEMWYRRAPSEMTATTDTPEIPAHYHDYMMHYALHLYHTKNGDQADADRHLKVYAILEKEMAQVTKQIQLAQLPRVKNKRIRRW